ncbi:hypothetical protein ACFFGT_25540 [Mucilaginibacter angelicae]|uniref:YcxB-like protein domain-containing protein n=1 Tax=Mucilaginibacter angelicae TaxID=869718 RepID=A0ABV6LDP8_9SPHI
MSEKIITIPFNYDHFLQSRRIYQDYYAKKFYGRNVWFTIFGIVCFLMVWALNDHKEITGLALTGAYLIYILLVWMGFFERRFKFSRRSKAQAKLLKATENVVAIYTFTPDRLTYNDHEKAYSFNWQLFKPFEVYKNHILLSLKENDSLLFILGRQELGDDDYFAVQEILKEKTGDLLMSMSDAKKQMEDRS